MKNITRILSAALALCLLAALCLPARADGTQDCGAKLLAITFDAVSYTHLTLPTKLEV